MKKVGKYKLTATLGKGAFSVVLHGKDDTGKEYAVKMCEKQQLVQMDMLGELENEIAVLKRIHSRYIANLSDVIQTSRYYYLALDLCKCTLFTRITSSPAKKLDETDARKYFQELLLAVYSCHQQGVMHRDIKPENILLTAEDHIKLSDFGFACPVEKLCENKVQCGTRQYLAPEVFDLNQHTTDFDGFAADVWSSGVVLYAMVCGRLPFADNDPERLKAKIRAARLNFPAGLTPPCFALLQALLTPSPVQRPSVFQIMELPWFAEGFDQQLVEEINADIRRTRAIRIDQQEMPSQFLRHVPSSLGGRGDGFSPPQVESCSYHPSSASIDIGRQGMAIPANMAVSPGTTPSSLRCAFGPGAEVRPGAIHPFLQQQHFDPSPSASPHSPTILAGGGGMKMGSPTVPVVERRTMPMAIAGATQRGDGDVAECPESSPSD